MFALIGGWRVEGDGRNSTLLVWAVSIAMEIGPILARAGTYFIDRGRFYNKTQKQPNAQAHGIRFRSFDNNL